MRFIGITGGVGAGKSYILSVLEESCRCRILLADDIGNQVKLPGEICYEPLKELLGEECLAPDGTFDRGRMAAKIFADTELLQKVNAIIHPAVEQVVLDTVAAEREKGEIDYFFLEAALMIESGYEKYLDELWYVHTDVELRRARLKESRGYSDEKIDSILEKQLPEEVFFAHADAVIENGTSREATKEQILNLLASKS